MTAKRFRACFILRDTYIIYRSAIIRQYLLLPIVCLHITKLHPSNSLSSGVARFCRKSAWHNEEYRLNKFNKEFTTHPLFSYPTHFILEDYCSCHAPQNKIQTTIETKNMYQSHTIHGPNYSLHSYML